jgi:hypothetical protein
MVVTTGHCLIGYKPHRIRRTDDEINIKKVLVRGC